MSRVHVQPTAFPWVPLIITIAMALLVLLVAKWAVNYLVYMWNHRPAVSDGGGGGGSSKNKKKKKKKHVVISESDSESSSSSD